MDLQAILGAIFVIGFGTVFAAVMATTNEQILTSQNLTGGMWDVTDTLLQIAPIFGGLLALYAMFYRGL